MTMLAQLCVTAEPPVGDPLHARKTRSAVLAGLVKGGDHVSSVSGNEAYSEPFLANCCNVKIC